MKQRYQRIAQLAGPHSVSALCQTLEVGRSGYYRWRGGQPCRRAQEDAQIAELLRQEHQQSHQTYGRPRLRLKLHDHGHWHSGKRIGRLMKAIGIYGRRRRRFRPCTTDSRHLNIPAPNRLENQRRPKAPNQVWVTDLTYVETGEGWLYTSVILDLYSRRVVGWAFDQQLDTALPLAALHMALGQRKPTTALIHHSDRGSQYASLPYRQVLNQYGLTQSMSRAGNCYDNATMESFWSTLKQELVYRGKFLTRAQARQAIFAYIETFYNPKRLHSALGYLSPVDFEQQNH
jgi:transposase InsO family protein